MVLNVDSECTCFHCSCKINFSTAQPHLYNCSFGHSLKSLPYEIRSAPSVSVFENRFKPFFLKKLFVIPLACFNF